MDENWGCPHFRYLNSMVYARYFTMGNFTKTFYG